MRPHVVWNSVRDSWAVGNGEMPWLLLLLSLQFLVGINTQTNRNEGGEGTPPKVAACAPRPWRRTHPRATPGTDSGCWCSGCRATPSSSWPPRRCASPCAHGTRTSSESSRAGRRSRTCARTSPGGGAPRILGSTAGRSPRRRSMLIPADGRLRPPRGSHQAREAAALAAAAMAASVR